jgi:hypothetical protein
MLTEEELKQYESEITSMGLLLERAREMVFAGEPFYPSAFIFAGGKMIMIATDFKREEDIEEFSDQIHRDCVTKKPRAVLFIGEITASFAASNLPLEEIKRIAPKPALMAQMMFSGGESIALVAEIVDLPDNERYVKDPVAMDSKRAAGETILRPWD